MMIYIYIYGYYISELKRNRLILIYIDSDIDIDIYIYIDSDFDIDICLCFYVMNSADNHSTCHLQVLLITSPRKSFWIRGKLGFRWLGNESTYCC